jgi:hypothetical protein
MERVSIYQPLDESDKFIHIIIMILEIRITQIKVFNIIILIFSFKEKLKVYNYYSYLKYGRKFTNG